MKFSNFLKTVSRSLKQVLHAPNKSFWLYKRFLKTLFSALASLPILLLNFGTSCSEIQIFPEYLSCIEHPCSESMFTEIQFFTEHMFRTYFVPNILFPLNIYGGRENYRT